MDPERRVVCGIAAVVAVVVASVAFFGWRACGRSVDAVGVDGAAIELKVNLRCDGWSSENTGLGVFVSGTQIDARDLSEDELRAVADCSFVFEDDANAAFERALERKSGEADHEA